MLKKKTNKKVKKIVKKKKCDPWINQNENNGTLVSTGDKYVT